MFSSLRCRDALGHVKMMWGADGNDPDGRVVQQFLEAVVGAAGSEPVLFGLGRSAAPLPTQDRAHLGVGVGFKGADVFARNPARPKNADTKAFHLPPPTPVQREPVGEGVHGPPRNVPSKRLYRSSNREHHKGAPLLCALETAFTGAQYEMQSKTGTRPVFADRTCRRLELRIPPTRESRF